MKSTSALVAVAVLFAACGGVPAEVADRPIVPACDINGVVYLPPGQGPGDDIANGTAAVRCLDSAWTTGEPAELEFILMGTEGEQYQAIVQVMGGSIVNYYRENDWGWEIHLGCSEFSLVEPGIPEVAGCASQKLDGN